MTDMRERNTKPIHNKAREIQRTTTTTTKLEKQGSRFEWSGNITKFETYQGHVDSTPEQCFSFTGGKRVITQEVAAVAWSWWQFTQKQCDSFLLLIKKGGNLINTRAIYLSFWHDGHLFLKRALYLQEWMITLRAGGTFGFLETRILDSFQTVSNPDLHDVEIAV